MVFTLIPQKVILTIYNNNNNKVISKELEISNITVIIGTGNTFYLI
jgi:hypothetical protein